MSKKFSWFFNLKKSAIIWKNILLSFENLFPLVAFFTKQSEEIKKKWKQIKKIHMWNNFINIMIY